MPKPSLDQHERRFDGWPTLPPAVGAQMPQRDGDIAELEELQERVFDAVKDGAEVPRAAYLDPMFEDDDIYWSVVDDGRWGIRYWPDDRAAEQLAIWRYDIDHRGIA